MSNNVDITISSDARAALNAWNSINRMAEKNISLMERVEARSKKASQAFQAGARGGFLSGASRQLGSMILGGLGANAILQRMTDSGRQFAEQGLEAAKTWDKVWREFQGQSGLRGKLADLAEINVRKIAQETGVSVEEVGKAATQMVSSGFSPQEATGGALREQLRGMLATNIVGKEDTSTEEIIRATASYLSAQGLDKNEQNTRDVNSRIATLYKTTNMQFADFMEFARESVGMKGVVDIGTQLASLSSLVDVMTAAEGSTGLRNVVQRMRTVRGTKEKTEGLRMLGIKPDEIDLVGEDLLTAFRRINEGIKSAKAEDIPIALKKIFEERGVAVAQHLLNSVDIIAQRIEEQKKGVDQYAKDVAFAQEGLNAALRRQESEQKGFMARTGKDRDALMYAESRQYMLEKGMAPWRADLNVEMARVFGYLNGATADFNLAPTPITGLPVSDKEFQVIQQRVNAKIQGLDISPDAIERNMLREPEVKRPVVLPRIPPGAFDKNGTTLIEGVNRMIEEMGGMVPSGSLSRRFSPAQLSGIQSQTEWESNPNRMFANTTMNPFYQRGQRFPQETQAALEMKSVGSEMAARRELFGELSGSEQGYLSHRLAGVRGKLDKLSGGEVGTYRLEQLYSRLNGSILEERTKPETPKNQSSEMPGQLAEKGIGVQIVEAIRGAVSNASAVLNGPDLKKTLTDLTEAIERNTRATQGNSQKSEQTPAAGQKSTYSPVSRRLGRAS